MRLSFRLILVIVSVWLLMQEAVRAQSRQRRAANTRVRQPAAAPRPQADGSSMVQQSRIQEQQVMGQVRAYQLQLEREEKLLAQRLAEAAKLRSRGLQQQDQRLLKQAEQYERRALAAYQQRVQQFEKRKFNSGATQPAATSPTKSSPPAKSRARTRPQTRPTQRSTSNANPWRRWSRNGWR